MHISLFIYFRRLLPEKNHGTSVLHYIGKCKEILKQFDYGVVYKIILSPVKRLILTLALSLP